MGVLLPSVRAWFFFFLFFVLFFSFAMRNVDLCPTWLL